MSDFSAAVSWNAIVFLGRIPSWYLVSLSICNTSSIYHLPALREPYSTFRADHYIHHELTDFKDRRPNLNLLHSIITVATVLFNFLFLLRPGIFFMENSKLLVFTEIVTFLTDVDRFPSDLDLNQPWYLLSKSFPGFPLHLYYLLTVYLGGYYLTKICRYLHGY